MSSKLFTVAIVLSILSMVSSDYLCNCYCPTSSNYVGYGTYPSSSTVCNAQNCANACVNTFAECSLNSAYGSCRNNGNGLTVPVIRLMIGLTATLIKQFI